MKEATLSTGFCNHSTKDDETDFNKEGVLGEISRPAVRMHKALVGGVEYLRGVINAVYLFWVYPF
jgi:hypothetical protein